MSGHVVGLPMMVTHSSVITTQLVMTTAAAGGAVIIAAGLAAGVRMLVQDCVAASVEKRNREKSEHVAWLNFQDRQRQMMLESTALEEAILASEHKLAAMELTGISKRTLSPGQEIPPKERAEEIAKLVRQRLSPQRASALLAELGAMLDTLPGVLRQIEGNPCSRLDAQQTAMMQRLATGEIIEEEDISGLKQTVLDTLAGFSAEIKIRAERREAVRSRVEAALDMVLFLEGVTARFSPELTGHAEELVFLRKKLGEAFDTDDVPEELIGMIERRMETLRAEIDKGMVNAANRRGLAASITRILGEMGYETVDDFDFSEAGAMTVAALRIPGGEIVKAALHQNRQLAFEVLHERAAGSSDAPLSTSEFTHLLHQEKRWCHDAHELFRRLVEEGYSYKINFEHELQQESVKVVVVETAEDILNAQDASEAPEKRYLDQ